MFVRRHRNAKLSRPALGIPPGVVEAGDTEPVGGSAIGKRPHRQTSLETLVLVGLDLGEAFAVVDAAMDLAVAASGAA